jgi:hypothetical protein
VPFADVARLFRLACQPCRAAESRKSQDLPSAPKYSKPVRRRTRPQPPSSASSGLVQRSYFRVKCTKMHKRKISTGVRTPHNHNKSLPLRRNWLRTAKPAQSNPTPQPVCIPEVPPLHPGAPPAPPHAQRCTKPKNRCHLPLSGNWVPSAKKTPSPSPDCAIAPVERTAGLKQTRVHLQNEILP